MVLQVTSGGVLSVFVGGTGVPGYLDATGVSARFSRYDSPCVAHWPFEAPEPTLSSVLFSDSPREITIDPATSDLYVVESGNHTIRKITAAKVVTTLAGSGGTSGTTDGTGTAARFTSPIGITFDAVNQCLYVADTGSNTIR